MEAVRDFITADAPTTSLSAAADRPGTSGDVVRHRNPVAVIAVKTVHTAIFLLELASIAWLAVSGLVGRRRICAQRRYRRRSRRGALAGRQMRP